MSQYFKTAALVFTCLTGTAANHSLAGDWPRWLGPNANNVAPADNRYEPNLEKWSVAWKASVGRGYSAVTVAGDRAYTLGHDEKSQETVFCLDAGSGDVLWKYQYDAQLMPAMHPGGPNATPTVIGNRVITLSKDGQVYCLSADKGAKIWQANLVEALGVKLPNWGFGSSPVVDGDQVIFCSGKVVALDLNSGKVLWTSKNQYQAGYATAVVFEQGGKKYIAALDGKGLSIISAADHEEVVRHPFKAMFDLTATTPFVLDGGKRILISGNQSSEMLGFDGSAVKVLWASTEVKNAMNNSVIFDGVLYGIDGKQQTPACRMVSVNLENGKVNWAKSDFGYGTTIGVGKTILALTENGELVTLKATPESYQEISRRQVLGKVCWTTPTFANHRIYVRNDRGDVVCLSRS